MKEIFDFVAKVSSRISFLTVDEEHNLIARAKKGDRNASSALFCANSRYLLKTAKAYEHLYGISLEDAFDAAVDGFFKAIEKFNLNSQNRLVTLAQWWIRHYEQEALYHNHLITIPHGKLKNLKDRNPGENADYESAKLYYASGMSLSLETPIGNNEEDETLGDLMRSSYGDPLVEVENKILSETVENFLNENLNEKENYILRLYFGIADGKEYSLSDIGKRMGYSRQRIDQIKKNAIKKLRSNPEISKNLREFVA